jgi:hypothetical protein
MPGDHPLDGAQPDAGSACPAYHEKAAQYPCAGGQGTHEDESDGPVRVADQVWRLVVAPAQCGLQPLGPEGAIRARQSPGELRHVVAEQVVMLPGHVRAPADASQSRHARHGYHGGVEFAIDRRSKTPL